MDYQMDENTGTGLLLWDMGRGERVRQEEEQRRIHHIRMSLWRTRFITGDDANGEETGREQCEEREQPEKRVSERIQSQQKTNQ